MPRIVDRNKKRKEIAVSAIKLFGRRGFEHTRMKDVAQEAGVGKGTIYIYFKNKEELLKGAFEVLMSGMTETVLSALEQERPPLETLCEITHFTIEAMVEVGHAYRFFLEYIVHQSRVENGHPILSQLLTEFRRGVATLLDEGIRRGEVRPDIDVTRTAAAFAAWFDGAAFHYIVLPKGPDMKEMAEQFLDMTLRGLSARGSKGVQ